jgi:Mg/Co/Ni transporter MgtE
MFEQDIAQIQDLIDHERLTELRELFAQYPIPDIADILMAVDQNNRVLLFRLLPREG